MRPVRRVLQRLESSCVNGADDDDTETDETALKEPISHDDAEAAFECTRPSCNADVIGRYREWHEEYGSV